MGHVWNLKENFENILKWITIKIQYIKIWGTQHVVMKENVVTLNAYIRKEEKSHIINLCSYLKNLEKGEQNKSKSSRKKEII